ncbi:MAG: hypothetical protein HQK54_06830 [Oligoflexales bacterium]|nr:hypothetical protein [Oligoflexales bacterium]
MANAAAAYFKILAKDTVKVAAAEKKLFRNLSFRQGRFPHRNEVKMMLLWPRMVCVFPLSHCCAHQEVFLLCFCQEIAHRILPEIVQPIFNSFQEMIKKEAKRAEAFTDSKIVGQG